MSFSHSDLRKKKREDAREYFLMGVISLKALGIVSDLDPGDKTIPK